MSEKPRRVELVRVDDEFSRLKVGTQGTVVREAVDVFGDLVLSVVWDDGSRLRLIAGKDAWKELGE